MGAFNRRIRRAIPVWTATALLLVAVGLPATVRADEVTELAARLSAMRGEVETLSSELDLRKQELRNDLDSLAQQKAELEVQIEKEKIRIREMKGAMNRRTEEVDRYSVSGDELKPVLLEAITALRSYVRAALPFRAPERLAELKKLGDQLNAGSVVPEKAAAMLWAFVEDELRLARQNALDRQVIALDGNEQIAEVVRIGMAMLFFRTEADTVGYAVRAGDEWQYRAVSATRDKEQIQNLFDSFKKQIRVGYFEIPNALAATGGER